MNYSQMSFNCVCKHQMECTHSLWNVVKIFRMIQISLSLSISLSPSSSSPYADKYSPLRQQLLLLCNRIHFWVHTKVDKITNSPRHYSLVGLHRECSLDHLKSTWAWMKQNMNESIIEFEKFLWISQFS